MKSRVLGLAACLAIVACCGAAPTVVSATVLCEKQVTPCGAGNTYAPGTLIEAALPPLTHTVIETGFGVVGCLENKVGMTTKAWGGSGAITVPARFFEFVIAQCTIPNGSGGTEACTVAPANYGEGEMEKWLGFFSNGKNGNGIFGISTSSRGAFGFSVTCGTFAKVRISCEFTNATNSTVTGGPIPGVPAATIMGAEKLKPVLGNLCPPGEATWKFIWAVSKPANFFLEAE